MRTPWLFLSIVFATAQSQVTFVGHQVLRIHANSEEQLALVKSLERMEHLKLDFWKEPVRTALPIDVRVPRKHVHTVKSFLESNGITYSVMIKNLQSLVDEEHVSMLISELRNGTYSFNYRAYHRLKEIYTWVKNLAAENPRLVRRQRIGRSSQGRPLHILKFSTGRKRPAIWIDSAIHGREWISPAVAIWIAKKITTDYGNDPSITSLLNKMDIFMLIMANPDGYVYSRTKATLASEAIEVLASLYGTRYTYGSIIQTINESSGNSIDWSYNQGIKYPYAFELRDEGQYGFVLPPSQIIPTAEETWLAIKKIMEHASNRLP
ncbi:carboxypeptidase A1-like isoform X3 [Carcharodon carcharias]|uniref:carboxypeptidase A1-like isoform X3 n=1 Tax=Carcharodon carcharias TaxID=13397 RepID=UPI001B7E8452|nr:carboxypeptidase A1-like isoform X3 [Carcharodon carcharias]